MKTITDYSMTVGAITDELVRNLEVINTAIYAVTSTPIVAE